MLMMIYFFGIVIAAASKMTKLRMEKTGNYAQRL